LKKRISFPGKTFLIGEYAVLEGASAILLNTKPRFHFFITEQKGRSCFHPESPAGQWLSRHPEILESFSIEYQDPYEGKGGFGFSGAQFNLVYLLKEILEGKTFEESDLSKMWKAYRSLNFKNQKPSGADIVSQWLGGVCMFSFDPFKAHSIHWPFPDLDFFLIRTKVKLNTWEHLDQIKEKNFSVLSSIVKKAVIYMDKSDKKGFISTLDEYTGELEKRGLVHQATRSFLDKVKKIKSVITAKGCGAMGAEVVAVFFNSMDKEEVRTYLKEENIIADFNNLTLGIKVTS
jgi:mevalonate kinase